MKLVMTSAATAIMLALQSKLSSSFAPSTAHVTTLPSRIPSHSPNCRTTVIASLHMVDPPHIDTGPNPPSKRSQRKAIERANKQTSDGSSTSNHPEAILKRQRLEQRNSPRRKHNYNERSVAMPIQDDFDVPLDRLTNTNFHPLADPTVRSADRHVVHDLHSRYVNKLDETTTAEDVVRAIKRAQNLHDLHDIREIAHFLLEEVDTSFAYGYRGSLLSRLAVAALHINNISIATRCITERRISHRSGMLPLESAAIVRGLLRCHCIKEAWEVLEDELSTPLAGWVDFHGGDVDHLEEEATRRRLEMRDRLVHRARSIGSIASRHFYEEEPTLGMRAIEKLRDMAATLKEAGLTTQELEMPWEKLVRGAALCESRRRDGKWDNESEDSVESPRQWPCNIVYNVLDAMIAFPSDNNDGTFEALCNALVRRTVFITGAVDLNGCPKADRGEVAFIGRSNVGKSSLVNMLTNRKSLAFTSKTPGKTQQFNYFAVNDKPELERELRYGDNVPGSKDLDSFYIVDLPGFGFAKVPQKQRQQWSDFMEEYFLRRDNLKVVFHLIDARHGPTDEDVKIMQKVGRLLNKKTHYIVILTKADKNVKGADSEKNPGKVSNAVREMLLETMKANRVGHAPVVLTSAQTRLGRDEVWKYLRLAAEV